MFLILCRSVLSRHLMQVKVNGIKKSNMNDDNKGGNGLQKSIQWLQPPTSNKEPPQPNDNNIEEDLNQQWNNDNRNDGNNNENGNNDNNNGDANENNSNKNNDNNKYNDAKAGLEVNQVENILTDSFSSNSEDFKKYFEKTKSRRKFQDVWMELHPNEEGWTFSNMPWPGMLHITLSCLYYYCHIIISKSFLRDGKST